VDEVIGRCTAEVERYRGGDTKLMAFFMGQIMKATKGKGNPKEIGKLLNERLGAP